MNENAINYIEGFIKKLDDKFTVTSMHPEGSLHYDFYAESGDQGVKISFGRDIIEDFEIAIEKYAGTDYYYRLESAIKFRVYVTLGQEGLLPRLDISSEILNERRDWPQDYKAKVELEKSVYEILYRGLKKISDFLSKTLKKHKGQGLELKEIEEEKEYIDDLITYYEKHNSFDEDNASAKSLGFLKAAVVCDIIDKENIKRQGDISPRVLKEIDRTIYSTVAILRKEPFLEVGLPDSIREYSTENRKEYPKDLEIKVHDDVIANDKKERKGLIFVACGQLTPEEIELGGQVKNLLEENGIDIFLAEAANDLRDLNSHIFKNLNDCTGFIAILHKRHKLNRTYDTSVWINQEIAIAAYLRSQQSREIPSLILYEEDAEKEGLIKYTIANPPTFKSSKEALSKIEKWIKFQNFNYKKKLPEIDIDLSKAYKTMGHSSGSKANGYYDISYALLFRIRNKSDINICLEDVRVENDLLGKGKIRTDHPKLTRLPHNVEAHKVNEIQLKIAFPNTISLDKIGDKFNLKIDFDFDEQTITKEIVTSFKNS